MLLMKDILDESDKRLREISKEVEFPLSKDEKNTMYVCCNMSYDDILCRCIICSRRNQNCYQ